MLDLDCSGLFWAGLLVGFIVGFLLCIAVDLFEQGRDKDQ